MDANKQIGKTRKALQTVHQEMQEQGNRKAADAISEVLKDEMSILRLAAIMAPKH